MTDQVYVQKFVISFVYNGSNASEISAAFPYIYVASIDGSLVVYNAGFLTVPVGVVISDQGQIIANSMDEFNDNFAQAS